MDTIDTPTSSNNEATGTTTAIGGTTLPETSTEASAGDINTFFEGLPDHLKAHKSLSKFDSVDKLADAYVNASKLIGKRISEVKPEELKGILDTEDLASMYRGMGVPETHEGYTLPEGVDPDIAALVKTKAHGMGLPADKLSELLNLETEVTSMARAKEQESWRTDVITRYGKDLNRNIEMASGAVKEFGGQELINFLNQSGLGDHPVVIDTFLRIGKQMQEDSIPFGKGSRTKGTEDIRKEISDLRKDQDFMAKWKAGDRKNAERMNNLYQKLDELERG